MSTNLKKCEYCGAVIPSDSQSCPNCNADLSENASNGSFILKLLCFVCPIIGLVISLSARKENIKQAYRWATIWGTLLWVLVYCIWG